MAQQSLDGKKSEADYRSKKYHVVSFRWSDFEPELSLFDGNEVESCDLEDLDIWVSREKTCVGNFEGGYTPCPEERSVERFQWCSDCSPSEIPRLECIFEPEECEGCEGGFCEKEHVIYLAFHGTVPKIGMTSKGRVKERMMEQGADAYALLEEVDNRRAARKDEKKYSDELDISQRVSAEKRLSSLSKSTDRWTIERRYLAASEKVSAGDLNYLEDYPISLPLRDVPRLRSTRGIHSGEKIGVKGKYLIYENNGLQALDLSDMVGRKVRFGKD